MSTTIEERSPATHTSALPPPPNAAARAELAIGGMTCASCVARIERKLGKLDGVEQANVNLATEHASVDYDPAQVGLPDLVRTIESAGYTARPLTDSAASPAQPGTGEEELSITGMTCASCVARIERKLRKLEGVRSASVNLATERASVTFDPARVKVAQLIGAIESAGYGAAPVVEGAAPGEDEEAIWRRDLRGKQRMLSIGVGLSVLLLLLA
ncbi:MAG TPA: copper ion binding protein, partial [Chloroflexota bacterium]|nr:copper ion binding protein [Chloroflexota bacterium]